MGRFRKLLAMALAGILTVHAALIPALAAEVVPTEETMAQSTSDADQAAAASAVETTPPETVVSLLALTAETTDTELTAPAETVSAETVPAETAPGETVPAETVPEETAAQETVPEQTVPEQTVPVQKQAREELPEPAEERSEQTQTLPASFKEDRDYEAVPLYMQTDYPDVYYGEGSVATSGCSIASLAMVATYMTGHTYRPDTLARYFADDGNNHMERLEYGSDTLQLVYEKNTNWHTTLQALREGKIAIVLLNDRSHFTQSQHFIVLTGLTEDGRILVNDPYAPNYNHWALKQGFERGFTEDAIVCGFEGAWVYDRSRMPEDVPRYEEEIPEPVNYGPVPLYFQSDYPNTRFADGTVATSGCSITSLAMVATYMTGHEYLPDELARYFGGQAENHMARLELGSETLQLPYEKNTNWHTTMQALRDGKVAIVLVNEKTPFTQSQHFLVLTGLTPDGRIRVNDSWKTNYASWDLKDGFANGFAPDVILKGFEGAWVYDKGAMPEEPFIYHEPEPDRSKSRYQGIQLSLAQEDLLAKVVWVEARGESPEGQQAVAEVVLNRLMSDRFADTLDEVIYGEGQFRSVPFLKDAEPGQAQYEAVEAALYGPNILPLDVYYFATWETNSNVWGEIGNHIFCYAE